MQISQPWQKRIKAKIGGGGFRVWGLGPDSVCADCLPFCTRRCALCCFRFVCDRALCISLMFRAPRVRAASRRAQILIVSGLGIYPTCREDKRDFPRLGAPFRGSSYTDNIRLRSILGVPVFGKTPSVLSNNLKTAPSRVQNPKVVSWQFMGGPSSSTQQYHARVISGRPQVVAVKRDNHEFDLKAMKVRGEGKGYRV